MYLFYVFFKTESWPSYASDELFSRPIKRRVLPVDGNKFTFTISHTSLSKERLDSREKCNRTKVGKENYS